MTASLQFDTFTYDSGHADTLHGLIDRAFSIVPPHARPKDSRAYLDYMQGPANPAGPAVVAVARLDGECVGNISATPFRFTTRAGGRLTAYQLGSVVVDTANQRQGIGGKLVGVITEHLAAIPDSFTYIYPNTRSHPVLLRNGYAAARDVPTYIHFPTPGSLFGAGNAADDARLHDRNLGPWRMTRGTIEDLLTLSADWPDDDGTQGFARDRTFFKWRFGGPGADSRYRFVTCRDDAGADAFGAVFANHRFAGQQFVILVDILSPDPRRHYGLALKAARAVGSMAGEHFVYVNSNIPRFPRQQPPGSVAPWGIAVPDAVNPRPLRLLYHPRADMDVGGEIDVSIAMTGDWMGF